MMEEIMRISNLMDGLNSAMLNVGIASPEYNILLKKWQELKVDLIKKVSELG